MNKTLITIPPELGYCVYINKRILNQNNTNNCKKVIDQLPKNRSFRITKTKQMVIQEIKNSGILEDAKQYGFVFDIVEDEFGNAYLSEQVKLDNTLRKLFSKRSKSTSNLGILYTAAENPDVDCVHETACIYRAMGTGRLDKGLPFYILLLAGIGRIDSINKPELKPWSSLFSFVDKAFKDIVFGNDALPSLHLQYFGQDSWINTNVTLTSPNLAHILPLHSSVYNFNFREIKYSPSRNKIYFPISDFELSVTYTLTEFIFRQNGYGTQYAKIAYNAYTVFAAAILETTDICKKILE